MGFHLELAILCFLQNFVSYLSSQLHRRTQVLCYIDVIDSNDTKQNSQESKQTNNQPTNQPHTDPSD